MRHKSAGLTGFMHPHCQEDSASRPQEYCAGSILQDETRPIVVLSVGDIQSVTTIFRVVVNIYELVETAHTGLSSVLRRMTAPSPKRSTHVARTPTQADMEWAGVA